METPPPPSSKPWKFIILLLSAFLIGVFSTIGAYYYLNSQKSQKTSTNKNPTPTKALDKKYTNERFGIKFSYPYYFLIAESETKSGSQTVLLAKSQKENDSNKTCLKNIECYGFNFGITLTQGYKVPTLSLEGYGQDNLFEYDFVVVDGKKALYKEFETKVGGRGFIYRLFIEKSPTEVLGIQVEAQDQQTIRIFRDKILPTIKFLTLNKYMNNKFGFSIDLPENMKAEDVGTDENPGPIAVSFNDTKGAAAFETIYFDKESTPSSLLKLNIGETQKCDLPSSCLYIRLNNFSGRELFYAFKNDHPWEAPPPEYIYLPRETNLKIWAAGFDETKSNGRLTKDLFEQILSSFEVL